MNIVGELRNYIDAIEQLIFEQGLNKDNKQVGRVLLHVHTAKEILQYDDNPRAISKWYLTLHDDYDQLCHLVLNKLKQAKAKAEERLQRGA